VRAGEVVNGGAAWIGSNGEVIAINN
jgi:hypothetical protein